MVVNTVGCQYEHIADFERHDAIVDLDPRIHAQSAAEIGFLGRNDDTVIVGQSATMNPGGNNNPTGSRRWPTRWRYG